MVNFFYEAARTAGVQIIGAIALYIAIPFLQPAIRFGRKVIVKLIKGESLYDLLKVGNLLKFNKNDTISQLALRTHAVDIIEVEVFSQRCIYIVNKIVTFFGLSIFVFFISVFVFPAFFILIAAVFFAIQYLSFGNSFLTPYGKNADEPIKMVAWQHNNVFYVGQPSSSLIQVVLSDKPIIDVVNTTFYKKLDIKKSSIDKGITLIAIPRIYIYLGLFPNKFVESFAIELTEFIRTHLDTKVV